MLALSHSRGCQRLDYMPFPKDLDVQNKFVVIALTVVADGVMRVSVARLSLLCNRIS